MTSKKHNWIIIVSLIGAPILFIILGILSSALLNNLRPEYVGTGPGMGAGIIWGVSAVLTFSIGLVFGPLVSYLLRNKNKPWLALMGYIVPPVFALVLCIVATISMLINIDKGA